MGINLLVCHLHLKSVKKLQKFVIFSTKLRRLEWVAMQYKKITFNNLPLCGKRTLCWHHIPLFNRLWILPISYYFSMLKITFLLNCTVQIWFDLPCKRYLDLFYHSLSLKTCFICKICCILKIWFSQCARCFWRIFDNRKNYCAVKILMNFNAIWNISYWMHNKTFKTCFSSWRHSGKNWAYPGILAILGLFFILYNGKLHCFNFVAGIWNFFQIFFSSLRNVFFLFRWDRRQKGFFGPP